MIAQGIRDPPYQHVIAMPGHLALCTFAARLPPTECMADKHQHTRQTHWHTAPDTLD